MTSRLFRTAPSDGFEWAVPVDEDDHEALREGPPEGRSAGAWSPPPMSLRTVEDDGTPLRPAPLPWLTSHVLVLKDEAIEAVGPLLEPFGAVIRAECDGADMAIFYAARVAGALDEERSEIVRFDSGRIMRLSRPVFRSDVVEGSGAFVLDEMPRGDLFLEAGLVDAIQASGASDGTRFVPVDG